MGVIVNAAINHVSKETIGTFDKERGKLMREKFPFD